MRKFLFATHGQLASGLKSSLEILTGVRDDVTTIDAYGPWGDPDERINTYFSALAPDDVVYVLVDISYGSVSQKIMPYITPNVHIIAGANLPLALQLVLAGDTVDIPAILEESKQALTYVNTLIAQTALDDEDE